MALQILQMAFVTVTKMIVNKIRPDIWSNMCFYHEYVLEPHANLTQRSTGTVIIETKGDVKYGGVFGHM